MITAVAVFDVPTDVTNVNVIVDGPAAADEEARNENAAGANAFGARTADAGVTVTPGGREDGVTVTFEVGAQPPATSDAVIVAAAPPPFRVTADGVAEGVKAGGRRFAMNVTVVPKPRGSLTSAVAVTGPGAMPGAALTAKATVWAGGIAGTGMVAGTTVSPAGSAGNVTVGAPT